MAAPVVLIPTDATWTAELAARTALKTGSAYWKLETDLNEDGSWDDRTSLLADNEVTVEGRQGIFQAAEATQATVVLKNVPKVFSEGAYAGCPLRLSAKIGASGYIVVFTGYVDARGARRNRGCVTRDTVTLTAYDAAKSAVVQRKCPSAALSGFKIAKASTPASSILHYLASLAGIASGNVDSTDVDLTKDYAAVGPDNNLWAELQDLAVQHSALLGFRWDGKLRFLTWTESEWNAATPEYTFDDANVHSFEAVGGEVLCNRARTPLRLHEMLAAGSLIYKNYDSWDNANNRNAITIAAGQYWPGGADAAAVGRLEYGANGERYPIGQAIITPTLGAVGSGSDIEYSGSGLTIVSFNGSTGATKQNVDSSEIILRNTSGSPVTVTRFEVRGTPVRVKSEMKVEHVDAGVTDDWDEVLREIPGKYGVDETQAKVTVKRWVDHGKVGRKEFSAVVDWTPHLQCGAIVRFNPTADVDADCYVAGYKHASGGPHTKTRTTLSLIEKVDRSDTVTPEVAYVTPGGGVIGPVQNAVQNAVLLRPTYTEVQVGYNAGGGTTTPTVPTIAVCKAVGTRAIQLKWDRQLNLTNFDRYEVQVSVDNGTWYALRFDGVAWGEGSGTDTDWQTESLVHTGIPAIIDENGDAIPRQLWYRVRRVTKAADASSWSDVEGAFISLVDNGDVAANGLIANSLDVGSIAAREIAFSDDVYAGADPYPPGAELIDFAQPDCRSSEGRTPTTREIAFVGGESVDEAGRRYRGPHAMRFYGNAGDSMPVRTNLVTKPENLVADASVWNSSYVDTLLTPLEYDGRRFTKIASNNASYDAHLYSGTLCSTAGVKSFSCVVKKGSATEARLFVQIYGGTWATRLEVTVTWAMLTVAASAGTLVDVEWIDEETVYIRGVSTAFSAGENCRVVLFAGQYIPPVGTHNYWTGIQLEDVEYPSPYIDLRKWPNRVRTYHGPNYALPLPTKMQLLFTFRPWFLQSTTTEYQLLTWWQDSNSFFIITLHPGNHNVNVYWQDNGTLRSLYCDTMSAGEWDQEWTVVFSFDFSSGDRYGATLVLFREDGSIHSFDNDWGGTPDTKSTTIEYLQCGWDAVEGAGGYVCTRLKIYSPDTVTFPAMNSLASVEAFLGSQTPIFDMKPEGYRSAFLPPTVQGAVGVFGITTNLVASPEDLTAAGGWTVESGASAVLQTSEIDGKKWTLVTRPAGATDLGVYRAVTLTGDGTKVMQGWVRKGTSDQAYLLLWDSTASVSRLKIDIVWSTMSVTCSAGTLLEAEWISPDIVWVCAQSSSCTAANTHAVYCRPVHASASVTAYFTAIQLEDYDIPKPYTPTTRAAGGLEYQFPNSIPPKFSIILWARPWFRYDQASTRYVLSFGNDSTHRFAVYYDATNDLFGVFWQDGGTARYLVSSTFTSSYPTNQWVMFALSVDLTQGGVTTGSIFKVFTVGGTRSTDIAWDGNIDAMASAFTKMRIGENYVTGNRFNGLFSDYLYLPGVLLTELEMETHYWKQRPWYSPSEAASGDRSVRIDSSGIRMHNAGLTITDYRNRLIDISNRTGMLARDAAGTVIHDIPDAPVLSGLTYGGHVLLFPVSSSVSGVDHSHTDTSTSHAGAYGTTTNINLSSALMRIGNAKNVIMSGVVTLSMASGKCSAGAQMSGWLGWSSVYNTAPPYYHRQGQCGHTTYTTFMSADFPFLGIFPIVWDSGVPYVTLAAYLVASGMTASNLYYYIGYTLYLIGVCV